MKIFIADIDSEGVAHPDTYLKGETYAELTTELVQDLKRIASQDFSDAVMLAWVTLFDSAGFEFSIGNGRHTLVRYTYFP